MVCIVVPVSYKIQKEYVNTDKDATRCGRDNQKLSQPYTPCAWVGDDTCGVATDTSLLSRVTHVLSAPGQVQR